MRLTLRTLLAWLDDTLSPSEVREIGKQVAESPFAKELVEKIHRVTRQRRLTVPPDKGPDAVDPILVAGYLDNELDPDQVAELEKKCLVSDVHLAEVASVHQVLSLIGQKAKVPIEARHRMYQLIKGREAVKPLASRASRQTEPLPMTEPVQPWVSAPPPHRPFLEQFGPAAAVVGLMLILCWTAWKTLSPSETSPARPPYVAVVGPVKPAPVTKDKNAGGPAQPESEDDMGEMGEAAKAEASASTTEAKTQTVAGSPKKAQGAEPGKGESPEKGDAMPKTDSTATEVRVPAGSVGLAARPDGVLLRFNPEGRDWVRLTAATPLREQDRLLNLEPFRSTLGVGTADVDLSGQTEIWVRATLPAYAARLTLAQGRVVLHGTAPSLPFEIQFVGKTVKVTPPPGGLVGVERVNRRAPGSPKAAAPVLRIYAADGPVKLDTNTTSTTLEGAGAVTVENDGTFSDVNAKAAPRWVAETEPVPYDRERGEQFLKYLPADRPVLASLVEASEDGQKEVCRLAISALHAVGDISLIVPLLNDRSGEAATVRRKAAIAVLREFLAQGPETSLEIRSQLRRVFGADLASTIEKLLVGYTPKEAGDEATFAKLVQHLANPDPDQVGIRQLALDNLMDLTGRDELDYNPEKPLDGKGLKAWRDLLHAHDLKSRGAAATPASPTPAAAPAATTTTPKPPK